MLEMPFIDYVLPMTINQDKLIINLKRKAISVPRLFIANSEARHENSQKRVGARKLVKDFGDWQEVLRFYELRAESKQNSWHV